MAKKCGVNTQCYIDSNGINSEEKTVSVILSDETPVEQYSYEIGGKFMLVLKHSTEAIDLSRKDAMSVYWSHNDYALPLGTYQDVRLEDGKLKATAHMDKDDTFAMQVFGKIEKGILKSLSVGADIIEKTITRDENDNVTVVATKWRPFEGSFTGNPANENAKVSLSKEDTNQHKEKEMEIGDMTQFKITLAKANDDDKVQMLSLLGGVQADEVIKLKNAHATAMSSLQDEHKVSLSKFSGAVSDAVAMVTSDEFSDISAEDKKVALSKVTLNKSGEFDADNLELHLLRAKKQTQTPSPEKVILEKDKNDYSEYDKASTNIRGEE